MIFSTYFWPEVIWALQLGFWASESPGSHIFLSKFIMVKWGKSWNHRLSGAQNPSWSAQITSGQKYDKTIILSCLRVNFEGLTPNTFFSVLTYLLNPPSVRFSNNYPQIIILFVVLQFMFLASNKIYYYKLQNFYWGIFVQLFLKKLWDLTECN